MHVLLDEASQPGLRDVIGSLLEAADTACIAVARVRLGVIDLSAAETGHVQSCRILLGRLDADGLTSLTPGGSGSAAHLMALYRFIASPRVQVRSAGMGAWLPDFSIYEGVSLPERPSAAVCLMGAHWFRAPPVAEGPSFSCLLTDERAVARARRRFDELWLGAHDVRGAVLDAISSVMHQGASGGS